MKGNVLKISILLILMLIFIFPVMAIFSFFSLSNEEEKEETKMDITTFNSEDYLIFNNKNAKINVDLIPFNSIVISDDKTPLGVTSGKEVTGKNLKDDFKGHEKLISDNELVFEIISKTGHSVFYLTYEELELVVNDKAKYYKFFALDDDNNLIRYVYVES